MSRMNLSLVLSAQDQAFSSTLRSGLRAVQRFASIASKPITVPLRWATGGLGLVGLNLGVRPLISGMDRLIERATRLDAVQRSFQSLVGENAKRAGELARRLSVASSGMLGMTESMELANRAIAGGLTLRQLGTAIEFISKKAVTTGKDAREALNTVITGLSRGSTLFLDDFGILVDGVEAVRAEFDRLRGGGAFDKLLPSEQKAEIVRQAIGEMGVQLRRMGLSGRESAFTWAQITGSVQNMGDRMLLAVARSKALRDALEGARDIFAGIEGHFSRGGSFRELLFGKGEGGAGLLSILGGGLKDAMENAGRLFVGGMLKGLAALGEAVAKAFAWIKTQFLGIWNLLPPKIRSALEHGAETVKQKILEAFAILSHIPQAIKDVWGPFFRRPGMAMQTLQAPGVALGRWVRDLLEGLWPARQRWFGPQSNALGGAGVFVPRMGFVNLGAANMAVALGQMGGRRGGIADAMRRVSADLFGALGWQRVSGAVRQFAAEFRGAAAAQRLPGAGGGGQPRDMDIPLTRPAFERLSARARLIAARLERLRRRGVAALSAERRTALRRAAREEERRLRLRGHRVRPQDRRRILRDLARQALAEEEGGLRNELDEVGDRLRGNEPHRRARLDRIGEGREAARERKADELIREIRAAVHGMLALTEAIGGDARKLARLA